MEIMPWFLLWAHAAHVNSMYVPSVLRFHPSHCPERPQTKQNRRCVHPL